MPLGCQILPNGAPDPSLVQPTRVEVTEAVGASTTFSLFYGFNIEEGDLPLLKEATPLAKPIDDGMIAVLAGLSAAARRT